MHLVKLYDMLPLMMLRVHGTCRGSNMVRLRRMGPSAVHLCSYMAELQLPNWGAAWCRAEAEQLNIELKEQVREQREAAAAAAGASAAEREALQSRLQLAEAELAATCAKLAAAREESEKKIREQCERTRCTPCHTFLYEEGLSGSRLLVGQQ